MNSDIRVDEREDFSKCCIGSAVPGEGRSSCRVSRGNDAIRPGCNRARRVCTRVIDDDQLPLRAREITPFERVDATREMPRGVMRGDYDRQTDWVSHVVGAMYAEVKHAQFFPQSAPSRALQISACRNAGA